MWIYSSTVDDFSGAWGFFCARRPDVCPAQRRPDRLVAAQAHQQDRRRARQDAPRIERHGPRHVEPGFERARAEVSDVQHVGLDFKQLLGATVQGIRSWGRISAAEFPHAKPRRTRRKKLVMALPRIRLRKILRQRNYSGHPFFQRETRYSFPLRGKE